MNYLVIGRDGADASTRRLEQRQAHLDSAVKMKEAGKLLYATAILEDGRMIGSVMVFNFSGAEELEAWRLQEPYVTGNVWETLEITECAIPPIFQ